MPRAVPSVRAKSFLRARKGAQAEDQIKRAIAEGGTLFAGGQYVAARNRFETALQIAIAAENDDRAARAISNIASCQFASHEYQQALQSYLDARRMSVRAGNTTTVAAIDANVASLYAQMGELDAAIQWLRGSLTQCNPELLPQMQIEMGSLLARQERLKSGSAAPRNSIREAMPFFRSGIDAARRNGNRSLYAVGWTHIGEQLLEDGDLAGAERAFLEAYRVRKLNRLPLDTSYWYLGELRLAQGDLESASALLDRAVDLVRRPQAPLSKWHVFDARGRVRLAQGRLQEAMDDMRIAVRLARTDRGASPAADTARIGIEGTLQQAYADLIETGNRLYFQTHDPSLIRETLEAAEENRAYSLRQLLNGKRSISFPPAYWEAVTRLQRAEVAALASHDPHTQSAASAARAEVVRLEAALVLDSPDLPAGLTARVQSCLDPATALLSFHLGKSVSWLWALDRKTLLLYALPPRAAIETQVQEATAAIREDAPDRVPQTARLYQTLFGRLAPRFQNKTKWLLALDEALLDVPVAALPESAGQPVYVVERHATEIIPGAGYWLDAGARKELRPASRMFVGIGDAIYNRADPRVPQRAPQPAPGLSQGLRLFAASARPAAATLSLPRLVGSSSELDRCSSVWPGQHVLLKGADATRQKLLDQLQRNPSVVHFATHFLESSDPQPSGLIALSLTDRDEAELLQPADISRWKVHAGLVVLSGCHSGAGATLPGAGLLGLTRAFLTAGAQSVLASRWATPDEEGDLFRSLYSVFGAETHADPTQALRVAQLEMLRSGGWQAQPRYWGTYFLVGTQ